jgi:Spy/CpxP family protein refolding chaperone
MPLQENMQNPPVLIPIPKKYICNIFQLHLPVIHGITMQRALFGVYQPRKEKDNMNRKLMVTMVMAAAMMSGGTGAVLAGQGPLHDLGGPPPGREIRLVSDKFEARIARILKLTEAQQTQIKALLDAEREQVEPLRNKMHESREKIMQAAETNVFDEVAVRTLAVAQSQIEVELIVSHTRTINKINALLTSEQRELLSILSPEHR